MTAMVGLYSLGQDLKSLLNNPKYSDIEILCENEVKLYGCKAILAARSDVLDRLFYNGMKESYERQVSFPHINSVGMEIVLEYIYTGMIQEDSLTKDNTVEAFYAADYFQLSKLQEFILKALKNRLEKDYMGNYLPELLSKVAERTPLSEYNVFLHSLIEMVAIIPLNIIQFGRLSINALRYLLYCIHEEDKPFATQEYDVFRYCAILSAMQVSDNAFRTLNERLPIFERLGNSIKVDCIKIPDRQEVAKELESLIQYIDFKQINIKVFANVIEPLGIIPPEVVENVYRSKALSSDLEPEIRPRPHKVDKFNYVMDESCGSKLIMEEGKITRVPNELTCHHNFKGVFEWDIMVENSCTYAWIGLCPSGNYNYERYAGIRDYSKIAVHLDMNKRACTFTVNGTKFPEVSGWNNLPAKLYPVVSLRPTGRLIIRSQQKN